VAAGSILLTGAGGFAGTHLLARLGGEDGALIECWRHPTAAAPPEARAGASGNSPRATVRWRALDLLDRRAVQTAIDELRPTRIYHLAGAADQGRSWAHSAEALQVNAFGTHVLLDAAARAGLSCRVLVTGSAAVYAPSTEPLGEDAPVGPTSPYGLSKLAQEMVAGHVPAGSRLDVIVCRPFNHIGPRQSPSYFSASFARQIAAIVRGDAPPVIRVGNLSARRDLTDVRDTVRAYEALMARGEPGGIYNVCSGRAHEIRAILDGLVAQSGVEVTVEVAPELMRPVDQPVLVGRYDRLHEATGWRTAITLEQTLGDLLRSWVDSSP